MEKTTPAEDYRNLMNEIDDIYESTEDVLEMENNPFENTDYETIETANGKITAFIKDDGEEGNRMTTIPTIGIAVNNDEVVRLTWKQAYALAKALKNITDIAHHG